MKKKHKIRIREHWRPPRFSVEAQRTQAHCHGVHRRCVLDGDVLGFDAASSPRTSLSSTHRPPVTSDCSAAGPTTEHAVRTPPHALYHECGELWFRSHDTRCI